MPHYFDAIGVMSEERRKLNIEIRRKDPRRDVIYLKNIRIFVGPGVKTIKDLVEEVRDLFPEWLPIDDDEAAGIEVYQGHYFLLKDQCVSLIEFDSKEDVIICLREAKPKTRELYQGDNESENRVRKRIRMDQQNGEPYDPLQPGIQHVESCPGIACPGMSCPGPSCPGMQPPMRSPHGLPQPGLQQQGMPQPGMQQPGMQQPGMQQPGIQQQPGMQQPIRIPSQMIMQQPRMPQPGVQQPRMPQPRMPQPGAQQPMIVRVALQQQVMQGAMRPQSPMQMAGPSNGPAQQPGGQMVNQNIGPGGQRMPQPQNPPEFLAEIFSEHPSLPPGMSVLSLGNNTVSYDDSGHPHFHGPESQYLESSPIMFQLFTAQQVKFGTFGSHSVLMVQSSSKNTLVLSIRRMMNPAIRALQQATTRALQEAKTSRNVKQEREEDDENNED